MEVYLIYETPGNLFMLICVIYSHSLELLLGQVTVLSQTAKPVCALLPFVRLLSL